MMDKQKILDRITNSPELPTIEEVDFIIRDNMRETQKMSKNILDNAYDCGLTGEQNKDTYEGKRLLELAQEFIEMNEQLWKQHEATEEEWIKLKKELESTLGRERLISERLNEYQKALLEFFDENKMTSH